MEAISKSCFICDEDLINRKRIKDADGNYFCPGCWEARKSFDSSQAKSVATTAAPSSSSGSAAPSALASTTSDGIKLPTPLTWPRAIGTSLVGLAAFAYLDLWPLGQALSHAESFSYSFKGMAFGWFALAVSVFALLANPLDFDRRF